MLAIVAASAREQPDFLPTLSATGGWHPAKIICQCARHHPALLANGGSILSSCKAMTWPSCATKSRLLALSSRTDVAGALCRQDQITPAKASGVKNRYHSICSLLLTVRVGKRPRRSVDSSTSCFANYWRIVLRICMTSARAWDSISKLLGSLLIGSLSIFRVIFAPPKRTVRMNGRRSCSRTHDRRRRRKGRSRGCRGLWLRVAAHRAFCPLIYVPVPTSTRSAD